jgi:hypothetical protein
VVCLSASYILLLFVHVSERLRHRGSEAAPFVVVALLAQSRRARYAACCLSLRLSTLAEPPLGPYASAHLQVPTSWCGICPSMMILEWLGFLDLLFPIPMS